MSGFWGNTEEDTVASGAAATMVAYAQPEPETGSVYGMTDAGQMDAEKIELASHTSNVTQADLDQLQGSVDGLVNQLMASNPNLTGKALADEVSRYLPEAQNLGQNVIAQAVQRAETQNSSPETLMNRNADGSNSQSEEKDQGMRAWINELLAPIMGMLTAIFGSSEMAGPQQAVEVSRAELGGFAPTNVPNLATPQLGQSAGRNT